MIFTSAWTKASIRECTMQILNCATCDTRPLDPPRLTSGIWTAQCPGCLAQNTLEPDYGNVFLPLRFRVVLGAASRRADRADDALRPTP